MIAEPNPLLMISSNASCIGLIVIMLHRWELAVYAPPLIALNIQSEICTKNK
jgi:hypothetical protein